MILLALGAGVARAQNVGEAVASWIGLDAPTGREAGAMQIVRQAMPEWRADAMGNLIIRRGSGRPRRLFACTIDAPSFAVSEITDDGYLRLHAAGNWRTNAWFAQGLEGQRIRVVTRGGWVPGVVAVRSTHLWRGGRAAEAAPTSVEDLWVDVGARSRAEVAAMGIALLDGVVRDWPLWNFNGWTSGPAAAERASCAALAAVAAQPGPAKGEAIFAITVQSAFDWAGLGAVVNALGNMDSIYLFTPQGMRDDKVRLPAGTDTKEMFISPMPAMQRGWHSESISDSTFLAYVAALAKIAGTKVPKSIPVLASRPVNDAVRADSLAATAVLLSTLTRTYAVSGFEAPMRATIMAQLPKWAKDLAKTDSAGNIVIAAGPERDTVVITAHMDEIGFTIKSIAHNGTMTLTPRGGFFRSLWEGQPAMLHMESGPVPGLFLPRDSGSSKQPDSVRAWFGADSATLVSRGVRLGMSVTGYKTPARLGDSRFTARSIDDRAGCTALILALRAIDPSKLPRKTYFLFTTREEIGLEGARAFAADHPKGIRRVYAIDTFVSSDSPLESHRFAYAPLGAGAVARALDNSSVTPPEEVAALVKLAAASGIPFQVGTTNGGNDGSEFTRYGVIDIPIAWPLRYSHSPAEVIDLADVLALGRIVTAVALHP
jgi:putative aminopeptidase FrvX